MAERTDGATLRDGLTDRLRDRHAGHDGRPEWRGLSHAWAFLVSVPAGVLLVIAADGRTASVAAAIYAATLVAALGASSAYHRLRVRPSTRDLLRRLDHSMIFLLIAASYVPVCVLALPRRWGVPLMVMTGSIAVVGIVLKVAAFGRLPWLQYALYPIMGWVAVVALPALFRHLSPGQLFLIVTGGVAYTAGSIVFLLRRPDPWPQRFGYHEIWHVFTIVGAALHFAAIATVVS